MQLRFKMQQYQADAARSVADAPHPEVPHQAGAETEAMPFPQIFAYVPWRHHVEIITHCKGLEEAAFYIERTVQEGWSRNALQNAISSFGQRGSDLAHMP